MDYHLNEYAFRFNRRRSKARGLLFHRLVQPAAQTTPQACETLLSARARTRRRRKGPAAVSAKQTVKLKGKG